MLLNKLCADASRNLKLTAVKVLLPLTWASCLRILCSVEAEPAVAGWYSIPTLNLRLSCRSCRNVPLCIWTQKITDAVLACKDFGNSRFWKNYSKQSSRIDFIILDKFFINRISSGFCFHLYILYSFKSQPWRNSVENLTLFSYYGVCCFLPTIHYSLKKVSTNFSMPYFFRRESQE